MLKNYLKIIIFSIILSTLFHQCKTYENVDNTLVNFFDLYIQKKEKEHQIISNNVVLIVGESKVEAEEKKIYIFFLNPKLMTDYQYNEVYLFRNYKTIINGKSTLLSKLLAQYPKLEYENFNQAEYPYYYRIDMWVITLNKNGKVIQIYPQRRRNQKILYKKQ